MRKAYMTQFLVCGLAAVLFLAGCDLAQNHLKVDRSNNMEFQDYRDALAARQPEPVPEEDLDPSIPGLQPYVADLSGDLKPMPLVSISVNQTIPLRDALYELAMQADYDIELDPSIRGSVIFTAREKPFDVVIDRIANIAGLRYKFEDDILRVEVDTPYNKTYKLDYLSFVRSNNGFIRNNIAVVSGEGADTGSGFEATVKGEADFWGELETNLTQILGSSAKALRTSRDPRITATEENPAPVEATAPAGGAGEAGEGEPNIEVQAPQAVLRVESLPIDPEGMEDEEDKAYVASFSLNKQGGMISVYATEKQHKEVIEYLTELKRSVTTQVLIEAKVLEVGLTDEFSAGIDWRELNLLSGELDVAYALNAGDLAGSLIRPEFSPAASATNTVLQYIGNDFSAAVAALSRFGTVQALASPRMTVLNNQSAVMTVASNEVYFEIDIDITEGTDGGGDRTEIDTDIRNVPEGVLIYVQPSVDIEDEMISMALRPTITRIESRVPDPGVAFVVATADIDDADALESLISEVPVVNVQEIDSVVRMRSGQALLLGGLIQDRTDSVQESVPVLGELPILGGLFRNQIDSVQKTELVILIKATIIDGSNVHGTDKELYRTFSQDRRPFRL